MVVVLAWKVKEYFDRKAEEDRIKAEEDRRKTEEDREQIRAEGRAEGEAIALARRREAERLGKETSDSVDAIYQRLRDEGWQPAQS